MTSIALTQDSLSNVKRALVQRFPNCKSSHLTEALAAACGHRTHAALLESLKKSDSADPDFVLLDDDAFEARLSGFGNKPLPANGYGTIFESLPYASSSDVIRTLSPRGRTLKFKSQRDRAWRNLMVAAINAGIDQRLFSIRPGDNRWPDATKDALTGIGDTYVYRFTVAGICGIASVSDAGWDELSIHASLWPTVDAERWIRCWNAGFLAGEVSASSWLERRDGAWLQVAKDKSFACRKARLQAVASIDVRPKGFADRGSFKI